jgi:CRP-like cAMP-binding protein
MHHPDLGRTSDNRLLAALPDDTRERLEPDLEPIELVQGEVLAEACDPIAYVYFPLTGVVSLTIQMRDGATAETGVVGRDGMLGKAVVLGVDRVPTRAVVQLPGAAARLPAAALRAELARGGPAREMLLRYVQAAMVQVTITSACNSLHDINHRLARWLLMCHDRIDSDEIALTHEFVAQMLGVQRAGVTLALGALETAGALHKSRGKIGVADRARLERSACECYGLVVEACARLFDV